MSAFLYTSFVLVLHKKRFPKQNSANGLSDRQIVWALQIHTVRFSVRHLIQDDMKKSFALFVVLALVFAVANLPTTEAISAGGSWKRAVEV